MARSLSNRLGYCHSKTFLSQSQTQLRNIVQKNFDSIVPSIKRCLNLELKQHMACNRQISIGVYCLVTIREFSSKGEKPPPANIRYSIEFFLDVCILRAAGFVFQYKTSRFLVVGLQYRARDPPPPICFQKTNRR